MSFFKSLAEDLAMGFGFKPKTKDFEARTAQTIAQNEGFDSVNQSSNAMRYMDKRGVTQADVGNFSPSTAPGYKSMRDFADGGGMGMSGARFSRGDVSNFDTDNDGYISEREYVAAETNFPDQFKTSTMGGIPSVSNALGFRPLGSFPSERDLLKNTGIPGTNIGTSGLVDYATGGGFVGNLLRGGQPNRLQQVNPNMERDARLTAEAVDAAVPITTRQEGPLRERPLDFFDQNIVESLRPKIRPVEDFARGGIASLVRR